MDLDGLPLYFVFYTVLDWTEMLSDDIPVPKCIKLIGIIRARNRPAGQPKSFLITLNINY